MYTGIDRTSMQTELRKLKTLPGNGVTVQGNSPEYTLTLKNNYGKIQFYDLDKM